MFKVGQKVVYIFQKIDGAPWNVVTPDPGVVYTVRAVGVVNAIPALWLVEIRNPATQWNDGVYEIGMNAEFFRPLVESKSEISFTTGADPESEKFDNRVRRKVRA